MTITRTLTYLTILWLTPFAFAAPIPELSFLPSVACADQLGQADPEAQQLQNLLKEVLPSVATGDPIVATVGVVGDLHELLVSSGAKLNAVRESMRNLLLIIARNQGQNSALGNMATRITKSGKDAKALLVCVLSEGCRSKYGKIQHLATNPKFKVVPFHALEGGDTDLGNVIVEDSEGEYLAKPLPQFLVIEGGPDLEPVSWTADFLHMATRFADFQLIEEWIEANQSILISQGLPDELFANHVRVQADRTVELDEGFLRIFMESRANSNEIGGFISVRAIPEALKYQAEHRHIAMAIIRQHNAITEYDSQKLSLTEQNVFEIGERLGRVMSATIEKNKTQNRVEAPPRLN